MFLSKGVREGCCYLPHCCHKGTQMLFTQPWSSSLRAMDEERGDHPDDEDEGEDVLDSIHAPAVEMLKTAPRTLGRTPEHEDDDADGAAESHSWQRLMSIVFHRMDILMMRDLERQCGLLGWYDVSIKKNIAHLQNVMHTVVCLEDQQEQRIQNIYASLVQLRRIVPEPPAGN